MSKSTYIAIAADGKPYKIDANKPQWLASCPETPLGMHDSIDAAQAAADEHEGGEVAAAVPVLVNKIGRSWHATIPGRSAVASRKGAAIDLLFKTMFDEATGSNLAEGVRK